METSLSDRLQKHSMISLIYTLVLTARMCDGLWHWKVVIGRPSTLVAPMARRHVYLRSFERNQSIRAWKILQSTLTIFPCLVPKPLSSLKHFSSFHFKCMMFAIYVNVPKMNLSCTPGLTSMNDKMHFSTLEPSKKLNLKKTQDYTIFFLFIVTILVWLCS